MLVEAVSKEKKYRIFSTVVDGNPYVVGFDSDAVTGKKYVAAYRRVYSGYIGNRKDVERLADLNSKHRSEGRDTHLEYSESGIVRVARVVEKLPQFELDAVLAKLNAEDKNKQ